MSYKWTVLFLVHASDDRTGKYAKQLFKILESTSHNETVKVLVLYGSLQPSKSEKNKIQVVLKELRTHASSNKQILEETKSIGSIDMGDEKELGKIFSDIKAEYPSDRFLMFTWDHGSGFGIFKMDPTERGINFNRGFDHGERELDAAAVLTNRNSGQNLRVERDISSSEDSFQMSVIVSEPIEEVRTRGVRALTPKEKKVVKTSMLTNDELRKIIKHPSEDNKVDLLIMMNCTMQMIETGYALHDAVEYLIAPQTCIFWAGYDYVSIINMLCADPEVQTEALARHAIDTLEEYYLTTSFKKHLNNLVVSVVRPSNSKQVKETIDEIADELCDDLKAAELDIKSARCDCEDLSKKYVHGIPYHFIDFVNYVHYLSKISRDLEIDMNKLKRVTKDYVLHIYKGNNYKQMTEGDIGKVNGFTIFFPPTADEAYDDSYYAWFYKENPHQTRFADQSSWRKFLIKYFKVEKAK